MKQFLCWKLVRRLKFEKSYYNYMNQQNRREEDCMISAAKKSMDATASAGFSPLPGKKRRRVARTTGDALGDDVIFRIFSFLDLVPLIRCSVVCKSWNTEINRLKLLRTQQHHNQHQTDSAGVSNYASNLSERLINIQMEELAMHQQRLSLQEGPVEISQWKAHSIGFKFNKCRMKRGLILTGVGDKMMRLWSAESCKGLDEYYLPDKSPLIDFDFDEVKVVGVVGTRLCIWRRTGTRNLFSSREDLFTRALCMRYVDPHAVVGCEDGRVHVFDMYGRRISQTIKMHDPERAVSCLSLSDEQLIFSGSSLGSISISDFSSDQAVATLHTTAYTAGGIKTLCLNPSRNLLFAGSKTGHASCWDLRTMRSLWNTVVSPHALYSMDHLKNDTSTLAVGGEDGVLRIIDQDSGQVLSRYIVGDNPTTNKNKNLIVERKKGIRLSEYDRLELMPLRRPITGLAVGMQKIVTTHGDGFVNVWKFQ